MKSKAIQCVKQDTDTQELLTLLYKKIFNIKYIRYVILHAGTLWRMAGR